jgi:outer membrane lipoprotein-sorting protein
MKKIFLMIGIFAGAAGLIAASGRADGPATQSAGTEPATQLSPSATDAVIQQLQRTLATVNTVESDFVEEKQLTMLDHTLVIHGHFALEKPDRMIWIISDPMQCVFSLSGEDIKQWDSESKVVSDFNAQGNPTFQAVSDQLKGWFSSDYKLLKQSYSVSVTSQDPLTLEFVPLPNTMSAGMFGRVVVTFGKDEKYITSMQIQEAGENAGNLTTIRYVNTHINEPVQPQTWEIPPHGS